MITTILLLLAFSTICAMGFIIAGFSRRLNELENAQAEFEAQHAAMLDARRNFWDAMSGQTHTTTNPTITVSDDQNT